MPHVRIDVHAHYYPEEYVAALAKLEWRDATDGFARNQVPLDERAGMLSDAKVDLQVLTLGARSPYVPDKPDAAAVARMGNDIYADIAKSNGGCYGAFGTVPLPHVDAAIAEASRCLDELKMVGIGLACSVAGQPLDDPAFDPFWAELNRRKTTVFLHPSFRSRDPHLNDYYLHSIIGACLEDSIAALRLVLSGLTTRYPDVNIIIPHFGGMLTSILPRIERHGDRSKLNRLYFDCANGWEPALRCACEAFGAGHIMLGTDFPYIGSIKENVDYVLNSKLTPDEKETILDRTAAKLLGLAA